MAVVYSVDGAELREAGGESFSTIVNSGKLTVKQAGSGLAIDVDGNTVDWVAKAANGPFKRVDTRSFMIATTDLMSFYYITLPKGLPETSYEHFNAILTAARDGKSIPAAPPAAPVAPAAAPVAAAATAAPAGDAAAAAPAAAGSTSQAGQQQGNPFGDLMSAIAKKAAHDTQMLGDMIAKKAQHDMNALQDQQHKTA